MTKNEMRKIIKDKINQFITDREKVQIETDIVCKKILQEKEYCSASIVLAYMPLPDELDVLTVINQALMDGKKVAVPKVTGLNEMNFYFLENEDNDNFCDKSGKYESIDESDDKAEGEVRFKNQIEKGYCGIFEPKNESKIFSVLKYNNQDFKEEKVVDKRDVEKIFVIVPGRAFTKNGFRLGRGKGFYDVYLNTLRKKNISFYSAGVCYSCQLVEDIPTDSKDFVMDKVFTI